MLRETFPSVMELQRHRGHIRLGVSPEPRTFAFKL
jgi:hypothetical protein